MIKDISKVSMPLELFYQKFEVIQHEYRKGIKEAVKNTEVEKEQKAFHLSHFFFFFRELSISCQVSSECNSCVLLEYMQRNLGSLLCLC